MRSKAWIMLLVAALAGLAAVGMAARWMQQQGGGRSQVAVAAGDIEIGGRITPEMVRMADWPQASMPPGAFSDAQPLAGRVVLTSLQRGEPIEWIADEILVAVGRRPNVEGLGLGSVGVICDDRGNVVVDNRMRTNMTTIYACGDVAGRAR